MTINVKFPRDPLDDQIGAMIRDVGWAVMGIGPGPTTPPFAYTAGLTERGFPELFISGLPIEVMHTFLNQLGRRIVDRGAGFHHGQRLTDIAQDGYETMLIDGHAHRGDPAPLSFAAARYGYPLRVQQMVWQDEKRHYPWEPGYDHDGAHQTLIEHMALP